MSLAACSSQSENLNVFSEDKAMKPYAYRDIVYCFSGDRLELRESTRFKVPGSGKTLTESGQFSQAILKIADVSVRFSS